MAANTRSKSHRSSERVEPAAFSERVAAKVGDAAGEVRIEHERVVLPVEPARVPDVVSTLKSDPDLLCDYFTFLSAVDWQDEGFEVLITVFSTVYENTVILKVRLPKENPSVPSISSIYQGANWHERECHEMFGIDFPGHPNLTNLYLAEDFVGHPLRKDFKLASRTFKPWPGAKDPDEAAGGGRG